MTTYFQLQIYACSNYNIIYFEQKKPTVKQKLFISLVSTFDLKMLCILFSYSYPVIRAVKGLKGKKILLQIKDIAEVILCHWPGWNYHHDTGPRMQSGSRIPTLDT